MSAKRVWITGAGSGLGAALAREYAACGYDVALTARRPDTLKQVIADFDDTSRGRIFTADVTRDDELEAVIEAVCTEYGPPDLIILNAGTYTPMGIDDFDSAKIMALFAVNFFAVARTIELLLPRMRLRGSGQIAVMASVAGDIGLPYAGPYSASKAALMRLCQSLEPEFSDAGLKLSVINPGFVATPLTARNEFAMPFMISADRAATIVRKQLARGRFEIRFPWQMSLCMRLLAAMPRSLSAKLTRRMLHR